MHGNSAQLRIPQHEVARWQRAQEQLLAGRYGAALVAYRALVNRFPSVPLLWFELGNAASGELDFAQANRAYRRALDLAPNDSSLLSMIGQQYQGLRQLEDARRCFARAVAASPDSVDARMSLAVWFEKERRLAEAWEQVEACLARHPRDDQARYFHAFLLHRLKKDAEAETALRDLIKDGPQYPYVKYASRHLLGVVLDQLGNYAEALKWLLEAKAQVRTITDTALLELRYDQADGIRRELLAGLTPEMIRRWRREAPAPKERYQTAFLGGHPRSGTTLLEQILDANPEVLAFDEPVAFEQEIVGHLNLSATPSQAPWRALDILPAARQTEVRRRYVKSLLREVPGEPAARVLLDKNPSPTMSLNIWLRVFPELKVIIALRDPRDVIISCFFLNIMLNATNVNFLSIERTVKHYVDLMDVWLRMRELGGFDWIETRYEDVVVNMEAEGRKATEFLGLSWHPNQARYHETARQKVLYAPTYHDVTQPVYNRAVGRWKRYAGALNPFEAKLAPYCRAFGYEV
ncbi:MAG TPA: sulfotransferase [Candidatus Baltobacteraceae bacterium]|jgi:tetratricopeptide (TPR) repeat protein|nr:sulfotransferase [Candidatus Baltobacteraceae bacterium]